MQHESEYHGKHTSAYLDEDSNSLDYEIYDDVKEDCIGRLSIKDDDYIKVDWIPFDKLGVQQEHYLYTAGFTSIEKALEFIDTHRRAMWNNNPIPLEDR